MSNLLKSCRSVASRLVDVLVPRDCLVCGGRAHHSAVCAPCDRGLPRLSRAVCPVCALPSLDGAVCGSCLRRPPAFDATHAVLDYAFPVDRLVQALKYQRRLTISSYFCRLLEPLGSQISADVLVPMPLHPERLRWRGFNQAVEIARPLARRWGLPLALQGARRRGNGPAQVALPWAERRANVRNAFECDKSFEGLAVLLVDDVMTSGATLEALAQVLKRRGARRVETLVVARTPSPY